MVEEQDGQTQFTLGSQLGPYEIKEIIGKGGMGTVYKAWDQSLKRMVALKVLAESIAGDLDAARRFTREAQAMANVSHENIVPIFTIGQDRGVNFFAMELVQGTTLHDLIVTGKKWTVSEVLSLTRQIVAGLAAAADKGIIHRDLKPANIILDQSGRIRLLDFGLSKIVTEGSTLTRTGMIMGTPDYMAPEQAEGNPIDLRSDIYALGATLYHLLKGAPPFSAPTPLSLLYKHVHDPLPPLDNTVVKMPDRFLALIRKAMAKKPIARFQNYREIQAELAMIENELLSRTAVRPPVSPPRPKTIIQSPLRKRRTVKTILGIMAILAILALIQNNREFRHLRKLFERSPSATTVIPVTATPVPDTPLMATETALAEKPMENLLSPTILPQPSPAVKLTAGPTKTVNAKATVDTTSVRSGSDPGKLLAEAERIYNDSAASERSTRISQLVPQSADAREQMGLAREFFKAATPAGDLLAEQALRVVLDRFPDNTALFPEASNKLTLLLFLASDTEGVVQHLRQTIKVMQARQYPWTELNDQLILLGLAHEKLQRNLLLASGCYRRAGGMSTSNPDDPVLIPEGREFKSVPLSQFLSHKKSQQSQRERPRGSR